MFEPLNRETLGTQVVRRLREHILVQGLRPGDRLPPERELAAQLGVSANTVREALKALEVIGVLSRRPRHGTVLQEVDFTTLAELAQFQLIQSFSDLAELFTARRLLEVQLLPLIAANATEEDYTRMEAAISLMEAEIDAGRPGMDADMAFHQAVVGAAGNRLLSRFGALLQEFFRQACPRISVGERNQRRSAGEHRRIVESLRGGDVAGAQQIMEAHLNSYLK